MKIASSDVRLLESLPISHLWLTDCRLDGSVINTLDAIGFDGRLEVQYRGDAQKELDYLKKNSRRLRFKVDFSQFDGPQEFSWEDTPEPTRQSPHRISCVSCSPDGTLMVSAAVDGTIGIWNLASGKKQGRLECIEDYCDANSVAFSPDGKSVAAAGRHFRGAGPSLDLWCVSSRRHLATFATGIGTVYSVVFSPDGKHLAAGRADGTIHVWQLGTNKPPVVVKGDGGSILCLAYCSNGRTIVSGDADGAVRTWEVETGRQTGVFNGRNGAIIGLACSRDGTTTVSGTRDGTINVWTFATGRSIALPKDGTYAGLSSVACSPDGRTLASGNSDGIIRVWDVPARKNVLTFRADRKAVHCVAFSPDGKLLLASGNDGIVKTWDMLAPKKNGEHKVLKGSDPLPHSSKTLARK